MRSSRANTLHTQPEDPAQAALKHMCCSFLHNGGCCPLIPPAALPRGRGSSPPTYTQERHR
eukprot:4535418-Alexandrium_andersonii.AAC.1